MNCRYSLILYEFRRLTFSARTHRDCMAKRFQFMKEDGWSCKKHRLNMSSE